MKFRREENNFSRQFHFPTREENLWFCIFPIQMSSYSLFLSRRSQSFRQGPLHTSKRSQSQNAVNSSITAHPILPIETGMVSYYFIIVSLPLSLHRETLKALFLVLNKY